MHQLPAAFAAMAALRQFIVYKVVPKPDRPGKSDKFPADWRTGQVVSAHDPQHWTDAETACRVATTWGAPWGVGFVFTEASGFWFLDIDECLQADGTWSPLALQLCGLLAGAAIEVSQSGRGLHLFGRGVIPPHGAKNPALHLELYHTGRFVALTGIGATGDCSTQHSAALSTIVSAYFPPKLLADEPVDLDAGPVAEWRGPLDDDELIRRALASQSMRSVFGNAARFTDLWDNNEPVLVTAYPPTPNSSDSYDRSSADMALFQHLAFWTGKDGARMHRLALRSRLAEREKWNRDDYLERSIKRAIGMQTQVCQDKPVEAPAALGSAPAALGPAAAAPTGPMPAPAAPAAAPPDGGATYIGTAEMPIYFAGCVWVQDQNVALVPGGDLLDAARFKVRYGGKSFVMDASNSRTIRNAWEAFTEHQVWSRPVAKTTCFEPLRPSLELMIVDNVLAVNTWVDPKPARTPGDASLFLDHLARLLPDQRDRAILLAYLAACVQHQGVKFQWAPFIQGTPGNMKTVLSRCVAEAIGRNIVHWPLAAKLAEKFNPWLYGHTLYCVEDVYVPREREDVFERLKPMITGGDGLEIEPKGVDVKTRRICGNFILNSNHKAGLAKGRDDRRIAPFFCAQQAPGDRERDGMDRAYRFRLYEWLNAGGYAVVSEFLWTYPIPPDFNPARGDEAPVTSATESMIQESRSYGADELAELIEQDKPGFRGGWVSSMAVERELRTIGLKLGPRKRGLLLEELGYVTHPALEADGRTSRIVLPDAGRPRLFVKKGSPLLTLTDPLTAYTAAQTAPS